MAVYNNNNEDEQTGSMLKSMGLLSFEVVFHTKDKGPGGKTLDITEGAGYMATLDAGRGERGVSVPRFFIGWRGASLATCFVRLQTILGSSVEITS